MHVRLPGTPRQRTLEVSASQGPQQAGCIPINSLQPVRPVDVRVQSVRRTPSSRLCLETKLTDVPTLISGLIFPVEAGIGGDLSIRNSTLSFER